MRTVVIILGGFVLWAVSLGIAKIVAGSGTSSAAAATSVFVIIWFFVAAANMWVGVSRAGYSVSDELPICLLIFLVPAVIAVLVKWKLL